MSAPAAFRPDAPVALPGPALRFAHPAPGRVAACLLAALIGIGLGLGPAPADAARTYDPYLVPRASYIPPLALWPAPSYRPKDFTIHRQGTLYHLFYTRVQRHVPMHWSNGQTTLLNETTFGHAISSDLETWVELDTVLAVSQDTTRWDAHHLWAPSVFEHGDTTWMYFTGVRDRQEGSTWVPRWQRVAAAWSTDPLLAQWTVLPTPRWSPCAEYGLPGLPWALCNATQPGRAADFRDPYVLPPEAGSGDPWLLYFTARPRYDQYNYVAGVAQASGPAGPWSDLGALWDTYYPTLNSKIESPHVFRRGLDWHLFFTGDDGTTGIAWHTTHDSPVGPWTTRPSLNVLLKDEKDHPKEIALDTEAWFASEHFTVPTPSGPAEYFAIVHSYDAQSVYNPPPPAPAEDISTIEFRSMEWDPAGFAFRLLCPNPVRTLAVTDASLTAGETIELVLACEGGTGRSADLEVFAEIGGGSLPLDPSEVGLPAVVALDDPETRIPWTVSLGPLAAGARLTVQVASQPLRASVALDVAPGEDEPEIVPVTRRAPSRTLRLAAGATLEPALEVELPGAGAARLELYDVRGRHVRTLLDGALPAGRSTHRWDGRDGSGRAVPAGLYFARLSSALGTRSARLVVWR